MTINEITTVCFVGAGTMGCYNALVAAVCGYQVVLYDVDENILQQVSQRQREQAPMLVGGGYCEEADIATAMEQVLVSADLATATSDADLVSESVFERLDIKREIHRQLDRVCPDKTIITTNSSNLLVSDMEDVLVRGDRFAALHTHLGSPLVDIVPGPRTDPSVLEVLQRYVQSLSGVPLILKKEYPGYVLNAMLSPVIGMSLAMVATGVATIEDVDRAWMRESRAPMGPFGMMDLFGLNLALDTWKYGERDVVQEALRPQVLALLQPYADRGEVGMKAGRGFYTYPEPAYQAAGFLEGGLDQERIYSALAVALVTNALCVAAEGVAEPEDIDRAWMVGMFLDTGPFPILEQIGQSDFLQAQAVEEAAGRLLPEKANTARAYLGRDESGQMTENLHE